MQEVSPQSNFFIPSQPHACKPYLTGKISGVTFAVVLPSNWGIARMVVVNMQLRSLTDPVLVSFLLIPLALIYLLSVVFANVSFVAR